MIHLIVCEAISLLFVLCFIQLMETIKVEEAVAKWEEDEKYPSIKGVANEK